MKMRIIRKSTLNDKYGTHIQIEDWNETYGFIPYASTIAVFPQRYVRCRAEIQFDNAENASECFEKLCKGDLMLSDCDFTVLEPGGKIALLKDKLKKWE